MSADNANKGHDQDLLPQQTIDPPIKAIFKLHSLNPVLNVALCSVDSNFNGQVDQEEENFEEQHCDSKEEIKQTCQMLIKAIGSHLDAANDHSKTSQRWILHLHQIQRQQQRYLQRNE